MDKFLLNNLISNYQQGEDGLGLVKAFPAVFSLLVATL